MKTNGEMKHGGKLLPEYRETWANYFVKYVKEYEKMGIPMWGLTVQNEAMAVQVWESFIFTASEEKDFVRDYLGPALHENGMEDIKLMIWDHNRELYQRVEAATKIQPQYIWGRRLPGRGDHQDNVGWFTSPLKELPAFRGGMGVGISSQSGKEYHTRP
jgi:glucosylceramidase